MGDRVVAKRLAAVLAADVAGYTARMEQDSDGTVAAWQAARETVINPRIAEFSGRIVKLTGDGFLAEFTTVQDAVGCALAMQADLRDNPLDFRMGVNLGDILDDGADIHGEGVNVAARIEALARPGGICISASVHEQVRHRLDCKFEDMGEVEVKNVSDPVHVIRILTGGETAAKRRGPPRWGVAAAVVLVIVAGGVGWWRLQAPAPAPMMETAMEPAAPPETTAPPAPALTTKKASIAVLPFVNLSGDKEQEYFADGMTEDLITDLSKISDLTVISRTTTSGYKGRKIDVREVGTQLGVRYVMEGSVRKVGDQVRINAQLIDAASGGHLWAERYDDELKDIFALQDRVLEKIVGALALKLSDKERKLLASKGTESVEAHDLYLKGLFEESKFNREANKEAIRLYEQALAIDPEYPHPYARLSNIYQLNPRSGWSDDVEGDLDKAVQLAEKAVTLDDQNPNFHWNLSRALARIHRPGMLKRGIEAMERAIQLDPDFADAHAFLGQLYTGDGRPEEAIRSIETAMGMNPGYPFWYLYMRGWAHYGARNYPAAIADLEAAMERSPTAQFVRWTLAAVYVEAGQQDDAEWQVDELKSMGFTGNIQTIAKTQPIQHPPYIKRYKAALLQAGIPE
ncbi:MAG: adenylate/guanylate cyclase domain-containing protein [Rhodospirillales bacterium]|nr:adenylate/guanylate cyclase domain-containing protein [Rhodospirillales bacterium]